jgi:predicted dehydrogenase
MSQIDRRTFLVGVGAALAAKGANDQINVGIVGLRSRGRDHINAYHRQTNVRIAALCDIDSAQLERGVALTKSLGRADPKTYKDFRKMLADKEIDAVSIATPNYWHALHTIWACQAGKDVYVEKPASHCIWEGRKMVEAARKYNRMVQVGMQSRSLNHKRKAIQLLHDGVIGDVYMAKGICYKRRLPIGSAPDSEPPLGVDYDTWLGPTSNRAFNPKRFHYNWHWFWETGNGDIGNQGVHELDIARWGLGTAQPKRIHSTGGLFLDHDQETPNTQTAEFEYGDKLLTFEVRGLLTNSEGTIGRRSDGYVGNLFYGSKGWMSVDSEDFQVHLGEKGEVSQQMRFTEPERTDTAPHVENFLKATRTRNYKDLNADILEGHISASLVHMANISYRTGHKLQFDAATETFTGDAEANKLIKQQYREPFVVPENV